MHQTRYDLVMNVSTTASEQDAKLMARLQLCIAGFGLCLVCSTWPLWWPSGDYPLIPWFWAVLQVPASVDRVLALGIVLGGMAVALISASDWLRCRRGRTSAKLSNPWLPVASTAWSVCLAGSVMLDQQRFQVWAWEFFWLTLFLNVASPRIALWCCRALVVGIYFYSGISKLDLGFVETQGLWLSQGLQQAVGWEAAAWGPVSDLGLLGFPLGELLVAGLLVFPGTSRWGVVGSWLMHLTLLLALGPLGWDQKPGVLLWNGFFLLSVPMLFIGNEPQGPSLREVWRNVTASCSSHRGQSLLSRGDRFCVIAVLALSLWPALEGIGFCDHWPAWAVYSSRPEIVSIAVSEDEVTRLPESLQTHIGPPEPLSDWRPVSIDQWSFAQRNCPVYPQGRYRLAVARHLEATGGVTLRVIERKTQDRTSRSRPTRQIMNLITDCQDRFWFNTQSRRLWPQPLVSFGDRMIAVTAQFFVACYALALLLSARQRSGTRPSLAIASFWTAGWLGLVAHVVCAFHFRHHWSHVAALQHTAQRTAEVTGWYWSGGLYINALFLVFWAVDVGRVWREALGKTPVAALWWRRTVQGLFLFMIFNATVVFGPWHWTAASLLLALLWGITRRISAHPRSLPECPAETSSVTPVHPPEDDRPE